MSRPPSMPRYTCPSIDHLKGQITEAIKLANEGMTLEDPEDLLASLRAIQRTLDGEASSLEDIRDANSQLRACAEYWQAEAARLEAEA